MNKTNKITCLFLDIGGVLLSDGWDHNARKRSAVKFNLDVPEMEGRHHLIFETYEEGKVTMDEYLNMVVFYKERSFTKAQFRSFIFAQTEPHPDMIELVTKLKIEYGLKIAVVSNEARELNDFRIRTFKLDDFVDFYISSCFIHLRKPDADIFRMSLEIAHVLPEQVVFIDDQPLFVQIAEGLGIRGIHHTDYKSTLAQLAAFGLQHNERVIT
ncbi:MAG: HAD family phosphatase [Paludibacter sp.]|nr:HAD family phosphatase [Paludibacter sp.]